MPVFELRPANAAVSLDPRVRSSNGHSAGPSAAVLSRREREILGMLANGMKGSEISHELGISSETVRTHVRNAMRKLAARTRVHAVTLALQRREITPHERC